MPNLHCKIAKKKKIESIHASSQRIRENQVTQAWFAGDIYHCTRQEISISTEGKNALKCWNVKNNCLSFVQVRQKNIASMKWEWPSYWCFRKARIHHLLMVNLPIWNNFQLGEGSMIWINSTPLFLLTNRLSWTLLDPLLTQMLDQSWLTSLWWFMIVCVCSWIHTSW